MSRRFQQPHHGFASPALNLPATGTAAGKS
jgi:hypothetical protein